ncbi:hypothetical protein Tco_0159980, partial [Tanacetum coccineum]
VLADATQATGFPPSSSIHTNAFVHGNDVPTGTASDFTANPSNKGLSADLLGPDVNEDNFAARMAAIIAERRRKFVAQSSTIYTTGWTFKHVRSFFDDQLKDEFEKIRHALDNLQDQNLKRSLKIPGADVEQHGSKKSKSFAALQTPVPAASHQSSAGVTPDVHQSPFVDTLPATPP